MIYTSSTGAILSKDAMRKLFEQNMLGETYSLQDTGDQDTIEEAPTEARGRR